VTEAAERPVWRTNVLWAVLAVFLVFGSVGAATFVYGLTMIWVGEWVGVPVAAFGAAVAVLAFLFLVGILYRVDRYRGANGRRVDLFE
jgi:membrane protein YdbS with pleckstrin-like domain